MCDSCTVIPHCNFPWNPPVTPSVTTVEIKGLVFTQPVPPPVCTGTGWVPGDIQSDPYWTSGLYRKHHCGICGQDIDVDNMGRLVLHPYKAP